MSATKEYIGDSVYVAIDDFGGIVLTTENGVYNDPSNRIVLEPEVYRALTRFVDNHQPESNSNMNDTTTATATEPTQRTPTPDYAEAAKRYLTAEAAERYCAGDMTATNDFGHQAIARIASEIAAERIQAPERPHPSPELIDAMQALAGRVGKAFGDSYPGILFSVYHQYDGGSSISFSCYSRGESFNGKTLTELETNIFAEPPAAKLRKQAAKLIEQAQELEKKALELEKPAAEAQAQPA